MGGDGGSIPRRCEMVKEKPKPEQKDKDQDMVGKWQHCAISGQPLVKPIVACRLGRLYNKEAVINHLLNKTGKSHIRKLSDVKELNLSPNNDHKSEIKADIYIDNYTAPYACPVTGLEMSGRYRCGCVVSEKAIVEVPTETCHKCNGSVVSNNMIVINGNEKDIETLTKRIIELREASKKEKKAKKDSKAKGKKSAPILISDEKAKKRQKTETNAESDSKVKQSDTYKKLFHSNQPEKTKDQKAHWVTFNPYYN